MKKDWATTSLAELCELFVDGDWVESKDQSSKGIRLIQTGNIGEGVYKDRTEKARYVSEATFKQLRCTEVVKGDCLISRLPAPVGRSCILPSLGEKMITAVDCTIVRFKTNQILPRFFTFFSQSERYLSAIANACTGTTRSRISRSNLGLTPIPLPPLAEQERIVKLLDEALAGLVTAKANAEMNLRNVSALFEGRLQSVFAQRGNGWVEMAIGDVFDTATGTTPSKSVSAYYGNSIPFVKPPELSDAYLDSAADSLSKAGAAVARTLPPRSILVSCIGNLGKIALNTVTVAFNQQINAILPDERKAIPELMFFQALCSSFKEQLEAMASGTTVPIVNKSRFNSIRIVIPPLLEQWKIVANLHELHSEIKRLRCLYHQKRAVLAVLEKSLLHQAFSGAL